MDTLVPAFMRWPVPEQSLVDAEPGQAYLVDSWHREECAMCGGRGVMVVDHDHETGLTRGLLCRSCNVREGRSFAPVWMLWRAGLNPARCFGWEEDYWSGFSSLDASNRPAADWDTMRKGAEACGRIG